MASNDNLTGSLGDLYRHSKKKPPARRRKFAPPPRPRSGRTMALDPFFVATVVLLVCGFAFQFFLMGWLEFF